MSTAVRTVRWSLAALWLTAIAACTRAPEAPDGGGPTDDIVQTEMDAPGDDAVDPSMPDMAVANQPDVLRSGVRPGSGAGSRTAPVAAGSLPSARCTNLGAVVVPDDVLTPTLLDHSGNAYVMGTGSTGTFNGSAWYFWAYFSGNPATASPRQVDLGLYPETDWSTASHLLLLGNQCRGSGSSFACTHYYFQQSGAAVYSAIPPTGGARFVASFSNVVLTEVAFDGAGHARPVAGGGCVTLARYAFSSTMYVAPTAPDAATGGSGTLSGGEAGAGAMGTPAPVRLACSSTERGCFVDGATECVWTASSTTGVCTAGCAATSDCAAGFVCVAFGSEGRCVPGCVAGPCPDIRLACLAVYDAYHRPATACLPPEWFGPARCGDLACSASETCESCNGDCGACRCGDEHCTTGETCSSCPDDCGACLCGACAGRTCADGNSCGPRRCDGVRGCYATNGTCPTIDGVACPARAAYDVCTSAFDCGTRERCMALNGRPLRCREDCISDGDCAAVPSGFDGRTFSCILDSGTGSSVCVVRCSGPTDTCPFGSTCQRLADGTYGACN